MRRMNITLAGAVIAIGVASTSAFAGGGVVITFVPSSTEVSVGEEFTVDIFMETFLSVDVGVVGYGFDLDFDGSILSYDPNTDVALGGDFDPSPVPGDGDGIAGLVLPPGDPLMGDNILLATVTFSADQIGTTLLSGSVTIGDPLEGFVLNGGQLAPFLFESIEITVVPIPPALLAGLAGLGMVGVVRRRRA